VDVHDRDFPLGRVPEHRFTRLDRHWEAATRLAEVVLGRQSLSDREGATHGVAFTVDMNDLFEKFIEEIVAERARAARLVLVPQAQRRLTPSVHMRPDLVLQSAGVDLAVGDAKCKRLEIAELPNADLYQLTAYCVALGLPKGMLVYATHEPTRTEVVERAGTELLIAGVDLSLPPQALIRQAEEVGDRLVAQALEFRAAA
jgi:5-methylcytosine-specific restriction enzyme subunit McrC